MAKADEEPKLFSEIVKAAFLFLKIALAIGIPIVVILTLLRNHPFVAISVVYGLMFTALIVYLGYQSYMWKKKDVEWDRKWKAQQEERDRSLRKGESGDG